MSASGSPGSGPAGHAPLERGVAPQVRQQEAAGPTEQSSSGSDGGIDYLQSAAGNAAVSSLLAPRPGDLVRDVVGSTGRPLDGTTRSFVKEATGMDASGVQVHEGPQAAAAARSVDAEMFASGQHLVAPRGLDVTTQEGAFKTVHEIHHIVSQQARGPVDGTETSDGLKISDPSDRFEREADQVAADAVHRQFGSG